MGGAAVNCWSEAARRVMRQWKDWVIVASLLTGAGAAAVLWLAAPLATGTQVAMQAAYAIWAAAFLLYALWLAKRRFSPGGIRLGRATQRREFWGAVAVAAVLALWLPWRLATWVPRFESLAAQAGSAGVRFLLGWALFTGGICWLAACLGLLSGEKGDGETIQSVERESPAAD